MLACALLFLPWALPRETISGLLGRWRVTGSGLRWWFGYAAGGVVDALFRWEPDHCVQVYLQERDARKVMYEWS